MNSRRWKIGSFELLPADSVLPLEELMSYDRLETGAGNARRVRDLLARPENKTAILDICRSLGTAASQATDTQPWWDDIYHALLTGRLVLLRRRGAATRK